MALSDHKSEQRKIKTNAEVVFFLKGALNLLMFKPSMCSLSSLQMWQLAARSEERSMEEEY